MWIVKMNMPLILMSLVGAGDDRHCHSVKKGFRAVSATAD